jgi:hypothetical protein
VNTEMLTKLAYTTTVENCPVITTVHVHVVASTVTTAEKGYETGDVALAISPRWLDGLKDIAKQVKRDVPCASKKRQICALTEARLNAFRDKVVEAMKPGNPLEFLNDIPLPRIAIKAPNIANLVAKIASRRVITITAISIATYKAAQVASGLN